jgi:hypothetical protein
VDLDTVKLARRIKGALAFASVGLLLVACSAGADDPSNGTYTVAFPSTAAAVATDTVQLFFFDVPDGEARNDFCQSLIQARKRQEPQSAALTGPIVNICELLGGRKPITVPYGEKAVLAVGRRLQSDFLSGCAIETFGDGDTALDIDLALVDVSAAVPSTDCNSVGDFCAAPQRCTAE